MGLGSENISGLFVFGALGCVCLLYFCLLYLGCCVLEVFAGDGRVVGGVGGREEGRKRSDGRVISGVGEREERRKGERKRERVKEWV